MSKLLSVQVIISPPNWFLSRAFFSLDFRGFYPVGFCPRRLCLRGFCPRFLLVINKITKKENQLEFSFHRYWKIVAKVGITLSLHIVTRLCYYYVAAFLWLFLNSLDFRGFTHIAQHHTPKMLIKISTAIAVGSSGYV